MSKIKKGSMIMELQYNEKTYRPATGRDEMELPLPRYNE
jgi:hypothetical protein